jgi:hypothetical protein
MNAILRNATISVSIFLSLVAGNAGLAQLTKLPDQKPPLPSKQHYTKDSFKKLEQVPSNFPVPLYKSNVVATDCQEATSLTGIHSITAVIRTNDPPLTPFEWYQSEVRSEGFDDLKVPQPTGMPAGVSVYYLKARKPGQLLTLSCSRMPKYPQTVISITVTAK